MCFEDERWGGGEEWGRGGVGWSENLGRGDGTFRGVRSLILSEPGEILIFDPWHVVIVVIVILLFGPFSHDEMILENSDQFPSIQ